MAAAATGALAGIGGTPLVELVRVAPTDGARVLAKLEFTNPTGSMKDRMARAAIETAAADGRLQRGDTVVEYTSGTTGVSLAFVCAALGYGLHIVFSDAFSVEKGRMMRALGATVEEIPSDNGEITESLIKRIIARAGEVASEPGHWWCDQLNNHDAVDGYLALGDEIWTQTDGRVDAFVHSVGTAHSIHGAAAALRAHGAPIHVTAGARGGPVHRCVVGRQCGRCVAGGATARARRHGRHDPVRLRAPLPVHRSVQRSLSRGAGFSSAVEGTAARGTRARSARSWSRSRAGVPPRRRRRPTSPPRTPPRRFRRRRACRILRRRRS